MFYRRIIRKLSRELYILSLTNNNFGAVKDSLEAVLRAIHKKNRQFLFLDTSPAINESYALSEQHMLAELDDIAIIIQGPIQGHECFIKESVETYHRHYPGIKIILSTWRGEERLLDFDTRNKIHLVLSEKLEISGISNINLQIKSTLAGVKLARDLNKKITIRTRTDQRLTSAYGVSKTVEILLKKDSKYNSHIFIPSSNTFLYRMFGASDALQIAKTDILYEFWSCPIDDRNMEELEALRQQAKTNRQYSKLLICEVYLTYNYLRSRNDSLEFTFSEWLDALVKYFVIVDDSELGLIWGKYSFDKARFGGKSLLNTHYEVTSFDWFHLKENKPWYLNFEEVLDKGFSN